MRNPKTTRVPLGEVDKFAMRLNDLCGRMSKLINEIAEALPAWRGR
jgi:hypothetical protein